MRYFFILFLTSYLLLAQTDKLIIDAKNFEASDEKGISIFTGDVKLRKAKDKLDSNKLEVYMSKKQEGKNRVPLKYIATGNVSFTINSNDKVYKGKGDKVIYSPKEQQYIIEGNGFLNEIVEDRKLYGEKIYVNQGSGEAKVKGTKDKPVRFILNIESNDDKKADK